MSSAGAIRAGKAVVEIGTNNGPLQKGLRQAQQMLKAWGAGLQSTGQQLATAGTAALAPFVASTVAFAAFEQQMARVQALTSATGPEFVALSDEAKRLGAQTVFSASQAAEAMSFFALAGFKVDQILKATNPTLNLAAAGQMEIAQAADIAAKIMAGMGIEADDLTYATDVMTKAMTTANTDLIQLGDAFKYVGPIAKAAGYDLEEITAAIQLLSNAGIQGDMAGTTLRGAILSLADPSKEAQEMLSSLGVTTKDARGDLRSLVEIVGDMERALEGMGTGQKLEAVGKIFDARQAAGFAELISQGSAKLQAATLALGDASGTASRIAGVQLNTLKGDVTLLTSALEGLMIATTEAFGAELRTMLQGLGAAVSLTALWVKENRTTVLILAGLASGLVAAGVALLGLGAAMSLGATALGGLSTLLTLVTTGASTLIGIVVSLGATLLNPIGLIVSAWGGLVALWGTLVSTASAVAAALAFLVTPAGLAAAGFVALNALILAGVAALIYYSGIVSAVAGSVVRSFRWIRDTGLAAFEAIRSDGVIAWRGLTAAIQSGNLEAAWKVATAFLRLEWARAMGWLGEQWDATVSGLEIAWITAVTNIGNLWSKMLGLMAREAQTFTRALGPAGAGLTRELAVLRAVMAGSEAGRNRLLGKRVAEVSGRVSSSTAASQAAVDKARAELEAAVKAAGGGTPSGGGGAGAGGKPAGKPFDPQAAAAGVQQAAKVAAPANDLRSQQGLTAVLAAFGVRDNYQVQIAVNTKLAAKYAEEQAKLLDRIDRKTQQPAEDDTADLD